MIYLHEDRPNVDASSATMKTPLKLKYVRFVMLAFLESVPVASFQSMMDALIQNLLCLQNTLEFQTPHMINSDGMIGKRTEVIS
jgi:hypothetical protein